MRCRRRRSACWSAPAGELTDIVVRGSESGLHSGCCGPTRRATARASSARAVRGWRDRDRQRRVEPNGPGRPFAWSFVIGDPDPIALLPESGKPSGAAGTVVALPLRPGDHAGGVHGEQDLAGGGRRRRHLPRGLPWPGPDGADDRRLPWPADLVQAAGANTFAANVRVQRYQGRGS